jgi:L-cysteine:1D-myo-inositol 2-amino-2-deoxy-alpha-D-glucopyranoside ligase
VPELVAVGLPPATEPVRVPDSSSGRRVGVPGTAGELRVYVCGITPYDATHLGHAATYLLFDTLVRACRDTGLRVRLVQNVTDVDDPLLERAAQTGEDWRALAQRETELFRQDMTALRVLPPEHYVGAVEAIPQIAATVQRLVAAGAAYDVEGDVYYSVAAATHFGEVSGLPTEQMLALFGERGGDPDRTGKKDPLDPLLWRAARPGEPAWESPLGAGRPGWHIECATIALDRLGDVIDVQGGGADLLFPHHEMSAAHAATLTGHWPFARTNVHQALLGYRGEKMSKSRGNLVFVSRLREAGADPMAIRLALLGHSSRSEWEWRDDDLDRAAARLDRWREAVDRPAGADGARLAAAVRAALADGIDTPRATSAVDAWCDESGDDPAAPAQAAAVVDALLGISL